MGRLRRAYNPTVPSLDSATLAWVVMAVVTAIVEVSIPHFGLIFVSAGAFTAALVAWAGFSLEVQLIIFSVEVAASLLLLRPRLLKSLGSRGVPSRTESLIGHEGLVSVDIEPHVGAGRVNVRGEDWAARSVAPIPTGQRIRVVSADGVVLEVVPV